MKKTPLNAKKKYYERIKYNVFLMKYKHVLSFHEKQIYLVSNKELKLLKQVKKTYYKH